MSETPPSGDAPFDPAFVALEPGFLVGNGRFTMVRLIGRGGMGVVWLARDESLREDVALKFLPNEIRFDAVALDDLRRETARSRKLTHPNIIRIHDLFKDEREAFISMEYVDGPNLSDLRLEQPARVFTWKYLEPLVKQLCEALDYAHSEKVIHRDLKPANMMLDSRGRLKLSDFGIAAQVSDSVSRVSMVRHGKSGTVTYMSPQQMDGKLPQVTDDIYALGATLYELLTSRPPFFTGDISHQVRNLLPQPIDERLAELEIQNEVPPAVAALIMACLGKSPEQRPTSARAVAEWIGFQPVAPAPERRATLPDTNKRSLVDPAEESRWEIKPEIAVPRASGLPPTNPLHDEPQKISEPGPPVAGEQPGDFSASPTEEPAEVRLRIPLIAAAFAAVVVFGLGVGIFAWWLWDRAARRDAAAGAAPIISSSEFLRTEHVLTGHSGPVSSVAFSPDQKFLISGSADGTVRVYEMSRGELQWSAKADIGPITAVTVSRESKLLAAAGGTGLIRLYALPSGSVFQTLRIHSSPLTSAAFCPSGTYLASADEAGVVSLWDYEKGAEGPHWSAHNTPIRALAFAPDGKQLATGGTQDALIRIWNVPDGSAVKTIKGHQGIVWSLAYSPDGSMLLSSSRDRSARIWSTKNFSSVRTGQWRADLNLINAVTFSPDSKFIAAGSHRALKILKVDTLARGKERNIKATAIVRAVAFSPDGRAVAASGDDGLVHIWPFTGEAMFGGKPPPETPDDDSATAPAEMPAANSTALAAPPPQTDGEFASLFNGRDLTDWSGDLSVWSVRDNVIRGSASRSSTSDPSCLFWRGGTVEDFELRLSFRLISGNSGIYFRASPVAGFGAGGYQFDLLPDRPGNLLETGADRPRRVLYRVPGSVPAIPLGGWHEAVITATGGRIKHQLDGQMLCAIDDPFPNRPRSGSLALEATGGPTVVEFKDIRLRRIPTAGASPLTVAQWITLFDGSSLAAWQGWNAADWRSSWEILNGELRTLRGGNMSLTTREEFGDFELEFEWRVAPGANSGVFYRVPSGVVDLPKAAPEFQVVDDATPDGAKPITAAGSIYGVVPATNKRLAPLGSFNTARIVARGHQVEHWLNGLKVLDADLSSSTVQRVGFQRYQPGWAQATQGKIVLQNRVGEASFKNIRIRRLSDY